MVEDVLYSYDKHSKPSQEKGRTRSEQLEWYHL